VQPSPSDPSATQNSAAGAEPAPAAAGIAPEPQKPLDGAGRSLKSVLARGSLWVIGGYAGDQLLRLAGNLVLWRLLQPQAFGMMAIVNVFMQGIHMFTDVGIGPSIVQNKQGADPAYLNTAWTIQVVRGIAVAIVAALASIPLARFYGEPQLAPLGATVALSSVILGFRSTRMFTEARNVQVRRLISLNLICQTAGLTVMVVWGALTHSIWALVAGGLVAMSLETLLSFVMLPGIPNRLHWDPASARTMVRFGRWIFFSTALTFLVSQSDRLIFGKLVPLERLGVYSIATVWAGLPIAVLGQVAHNVIFPVLSRHYNAGGDLPRAFREARLPWLIFAGWLSTCLLAGGPTLIRFLYDHRALEAGWIVQLLAMGTWFYSVEKTNSIAFLSQGKSKWMAASSASKLVGMMIFIPLGFMRWGFPGAVAGYAASEAFRYVVSMIGVLRNNLRSHRQDLALTVCVIATSGAGLLTALEANHLLAGLAANAPRWAALIEGTAIFVVVAALWGGIFLVHRERAKKHVSAFAS